MTVTLTTSYEQFLTPDTVVQIKALCEDENYDLKSALEFIDEHGESDFNRYYEDYVELGEQYGFEAVDAYLTIYDVSDLDEFTGRYIGEFCSAARMAEDYFEEETSRLDYRISIDWDETGNYLINHEVDNAGEHYFRCHY
jgi:hypothetical protein